MADDTKTKLDGPRTSTGTLQEVFLGLVWLATSMYAARAELIGNTDGLSGPLGAAADALPGVVAATLLTAATIGSAASSRFHGAAGRLLAGVGVGTLFGLVTAVGVRFAYGDTPSITVLALVVTASGVLGGAVAILPGEVLEAALWGTTWVFFAGVIFGVLQPNVLKVLGGGPTADAAAQALAGTRFAYGAAMLTGLIGGVYAYRSLRADWHARAWYVVAGALPGVFLLAAEVLTRVGGSSVVKLVVPDAPTIDELGDAGRLRHALIVLAVGGVVAALAIGRNRREPEDEDDDEDSPEDD